MGLGRLGQVNSMCQVSFFSTEATWNSAYKPIYKATREQDSFPSFHSIISWFLSLTFSGNHIRVEAIVNDTVGCLCTGAYEDQLAQIGVIYGTGTNACYIEKLENIKTLSLNPNESDQVSPLTILYSTLLLFFNFMTFLEHCRTASKIETKRPWKWSTTLDLSRQVQRLDLSD